MSRNVGRVMYLLTRTHVAEEPRYRLYRCERQEAFNFFFSFRFHLILSVGVTCGATEDSNVLGENGKMLTALGM